MFESFNSWIISLQNSFSYFDQSFVICTAMYILLIRSVIVCLSSDENLNHEEAEIKEFIYLVLFVVSLGLNISYSFFMTPDHYVWITKVLIFIFPYLIVSLIFYYLKKFGNK